MPIFSSIFHKRKSPIRMWLQYQRSNDFLIFLSQRRFLQKYVILNVNTNNFRKQYIRRIVRTNALKSTFWRSVARQSWYRVNEYKRIMICSRANGLLSTRNSSFQKTDNFLIIWTLNLFYPRTEEWLIWKIWKKKIFTTYLDEWI